MKETYKFKDELLEYLSQTPLVPVSIKPIIDIYCGDSLEFIKGDAKPPKQRLEINGILLELQERKYIELNPTSGISSQFDNDLIKKTSIFKEDTNIKAKLTSLGEMEVNRLKDRELTRQLALSTQEANESTKTTNNSILRIQNRQTRILFVTGFAAVVSGIGCIGQLYITVWQQQSANKASQDLKPKSNYLSPHCQDTTCVTLADTATIKKP